MKTELNGGYWRLGGQRNGETLVKKCKFLLRS